MIRSRFLVIKLFAIGVLLLIQACHVSADSKSRNLTNVTKHIYAIHVNHLDIGDSAFVLKDQNGNIYCSQENIKNWNIICTEQEHYIYEGQSYYCLKDFKDADYRIDNQTSSLHITLPPQFFVGNRIPLQKDHFVYPESSSLGAFCNYDTLVLKGNGSAEEFRGYFSPGVFTNFGVGVSDFIVQHIEKQRSRKRHRNYGYGYSNKDDVIRLNTYWRYDIPSDLQTLVLGDSYIPTGTWSGSAGFGGIQFKRNFGTQPAFITFPMPSFEGEVAIPSVMDLYVNNALVKHGKEKAGPFSFDSIPVVTGAGEMKLVTTDILGQQQQVTVPYYAAPTLLKPELQDYNYSAGFLRKNFGRKSDDYDKFAFVGDHAIGVTDSFTGKARIEIVEDQQTAGVGGDFLVDLFGVLSLASAASSKSGRNGGLLSAGFSRQAFQSLSFGGRVKWLSKDFVQIGTRRRWSPKYIMSTFAGYSIPEVGSFSASYLRQEFRNRPNLDLLTATYSTGISNMASLNVSAMTTVNGRKQHTIYITLSTLLGESTNVSVGSRIEKGYNQGTFQVSQNQPLGPGYGYNLIANNGQNESYYGSFSAQNNTASLIVSGDHYKNRDIGRVQLKGSMALMNGSVYLSRDLGQSFAVVNLPDYPDVGVYYQNQYMGKTDDDGTLLIPRLLAYQENPIRLELNDLPIDAQIESDVVKPVPYYMSGLLVNFPIKPSNGAVMKLLLPSGEPVPIGSLVALNGESIPIGYEGKAYITGLAEQNTIHVTSKGEEYRCEVRYQKTKEPVPDLGVIKCTK